MERPVRGRKPATSEVEALLAPHLNGVELVGLATELVRIESHRNNPAHETAVARRIQEILLREGIEARIEEVRDGRYNVIGCLRGRGGGPTLMFNGHTDTVPPADMARPFDPEIRNGQLYGRGTCDMKGGLAAQLHAMIALKRSGLRLSGDLLFTGVIAEEDGTSLGSLDIIKKGVAADLVVVAEPTDLRVVVAHKGFDYYRIDVEGRPAHSSKPDSGVSAIFKAAKLVTAIEERFVSGNRLKTHPLLGSASLNVAAILGYARNEAITVLRGAPGDKPPGATVPDACSIFMDRRAIPGDATDDVLAAFQQLIDEMKASDPGLAAYPRFTPGSPELPSHPPLDNDPAHPLVRACLQIVAREIGGDCEPSGVPFWSDAALFNSLQAVPAIVFGPGHISLAHSNTEYVPVNDLITAARINALIAATVCNANPSQ